VKIERSEIFESRNRQGKSRFQVSGRDIELVIGTDELHHSMAIDAHLVAQPSTSLAKPF
jgi:hypothetical protein